MAAQYTMREESNCVKACRLLTEMGKELLMELLQESLTAAGFPSLDPFLKSKQSKLNSLSFKNLYQNQRDILFPHGGADTDTTQWDITLASLVARNCLHPLTPMQKNAIKTIRKLRNTLFGHIGEMKMNDNDFKTNWTNIKQDLTQAARWLLRNSVQYIHRLQTRSNEIEQEDVVKASVVKAIIESWHDSDIQTQKEIIAVKGRVDELSGQVKELKEDQTGIEREQQNQIDKVTQEQNSMKKEINIIKEGQSKIIQEQKSNVDSTIGLENQVTEMKEELTELKGQVKKGQTSLKTEEQSIGTSQTTQELRDLRSTLISYYRKHIVKVQPTLEGSYYLAHIWDIYAEPKLLLDDLSVKPNKGSGKNKEQCVSFEDIFSEGKSKFRQIYVCGDAGAGKTSLCKDIVAAWCSAHCPTQENISAEQVGSNMVDEDLSSTEDKMLKEEKEEEEEEILAMEFKDRLANWKQIKEKIDENKKIRTMLQFDYLFYISLRIAKNDFAIEDMILSQIFNNDPGRKDILSKILGNHSDKCLIILDGLDEWNAQQESNNAAVSDGIPGRDPNKKYTILTTSRPWKLETNRLKQTEIDRQIKLVGVKDKYRLMWKLVSYLNNVTEKQNKYFQFQSILTGRLKHLAEIPIVLKHLICLWFNDQPFGNSTTEVYSNLIEMIFKQSEKREKVTSFRFKGEGGELSTPKFFKKGGKCIKYKSLLASLGKLAFETLYTVDNKEQLVFDSSEVDIHGVCEEDISVALTVGILSQSIVPNVFCDNKSMSFLHKTFQEYFAALYISLHASQTVDMIKKIGSRCISVEKLFSMEMMLTFLSGMCPSIMKRMSQCIVTVINNDDEIIRYRNMKLEPAMEEEENMRDTNQSQGESLIMSIQSLMYCCYMESVDAGHDPLYLPLCDVYINYEIRSEYGFLEKYMTENPTNVISLTTDCGFLTNFGTFRCLEKVRLLGLVGDIHLSNNHKLRQLLILNSCYTYCTLDASLCKELQEVWLETSSFTAVKLNTSILKKVTMKCITTLPHNEYYSTIASVSSSKTLTHLHLESVKCNDHPDGKNCSYTIEDSKLTDLRELYLGNVTPTAIKLNTHVLTKLSLVNINTLPHNELCLTLDLMQGCHVLTKLHIESVLCKDHANAEECSYGIDVSDCKELEELYLYNILPTAVNLNTSIQKLEIRDIASLPHKELCSTMASIQTCHVIKTLHLVSIKCKDHKNGEDCSYGIDISKSNVLRELYLDNISPREINVRPECLNKVTMRNIHSLSHQGLCSTFARLSTCHMLKKLHLESINCKDHENGEDCSYGIDISKSNVLRKLYLDNISPRELNVRPEWLNKVTMRNIHSLSHQGLCSTFARLSTCHMLKMLHLESIKCKDHENGEDCSYGIDISKSNFLGELYLDNILPRELNVRLEGSNKVTMRNIHSLSHQGLCSTFARLSSCYSLEKLHLESIKCKDHENGEDCSYGIDISRNVELHELYLDNISPREVELIARLNWLNKVTMKNIHSLSHQGLCSTFAVLSECHSLKMFQLESVQCKDHTNESNCMFKLELSRRCSLDILYLIDVSPCDVTGCASIEEVILQDIHSLPHDTISSILNITNPEGITVQRVSCKDHGGNLECFNVDVESGRFNPSIFSNDDSDNNSDDRSGEGLPTDVTTDVTTDELLADSDTDDTDDEGLPTDVTTDVTTDELLAASDTDDTVDKKEDIV